MNPLFEAAREVCDFMTRKKWSHCVIGGLAVLRWGEPRNTQDVDFTLLTGFGSEEEFARPLLARFKGRNSDALDFALQHRVLLIHASNGWPVDISFGGFPFEEQMIERATFFEFAEGICLATCSAEDLFIMKAFAARDKDWHDAESVALRRKLDKRYVLKNLRPLCELKDAPDLLIRAKALLEGKR
ncbi:MAG: hypothetical protein PHV34_01200 [Verrucomicrobiae bacterium]|nr:hypothetical protein [Verrucomicrobiae bacterium]